MGEKTHLLRLQKLGFLGTAFLYPVSFFTFAGSKLKNNYEQLRDGIHFKSRFV